MTAGNFSKPPSQMLADALAKQYVSVHIEQGVPLLDRDVNLLGDLLSALLQRIVRRHIGDGVAGAPDATDFAIQPNGNPQDFAIRRGTYLAGGMVVTLAADSSYASQPAPPGAAPLPNLSARQAGDPDPRTDTVYLDVWTDEIDDTTDLGLGNADDVGSLTSTRAKAQFLVRVAENATAPPTEPAFHSYVALAQLVRPAAGNVSINDVRVTQLSIARMAQRMTVIESALGPVIDGVAPNLVLAGQKNPMIVTGRNLDLGGATVMLGTMPAIVATPTTSTQLAVTVPSSIAPGKYSLTVQSAIGKTTAPVQVTVDTPPPPPTFDTTTPIDPPHRPTGQQILLHGSHFASVNRITFNVAPPVYALLGGDLISVTDTLITVNVPDALSSQVGAAMTITASVDGVPAMTGRTGTLFTVDPQPAPAFSPTGSQITTTPTTNPVTQARGSPVTLHGTNFGASTTTTAVTFHGANTVSAASTDFVSVSPTAIVVKVPATLTPNTKYQVGVTVQGSSEVLSADQLTVT